MNEMEGGIPWTSKATGRNDGKLLWSRGRRRGWGGGIVREFARHGAWVGLIARGRDGLEGAQREVEQAGGRALVLPLDVSDPDAVEQAAGRVENEFGPIDVWVNNAMVSVFSPVREMTAEDYRRVTEVTYLGYVHGTLAALRRMLPRDRGRIVQVGSALAYRGIPLQSAYCAAKHAIQGFTESLRCELIHDNSNVRISMVQMPAMNTPQFDWSKSRMPRQPQPVPPIYEPEVGARAVYHAAHHYRREWYVGGITDVVIWGDKLAPAVGDWYLGRNGYESQMTDEQVNPDRPNNLWRPLPGDRGARGRFTPRSTDGSRQWWLTTNRSWLAVAGLALAGIAVASLAGSPRHTRFPGSKRRGRQEVRA
jgi:NAD(P)-dependent dehydrogenase (short-subunit alcohol dehydrogenase family)